MAFAIAAFKFAPNAKRLIIVETDAIVPRNPLLVNPETSVYNRIMYAQASKLEGLPIISLQTGEAVSWVKRPIIAITSLEAVAFQCVSPRHKQPLILTARDIRQLAPDCLIINDEADLSEPEDLIRLKDILETNFNPLEKPVITESERKLGSVEDYSLNLGTALIQKLQVRQSLLRSWLGASLVIDRSQIVDVTREHLVVRDATIKSTLMHAKAVPEIHP